MKVIGVEISGSSIKWVAIEGTNKAGSLVVLQRKTMEVPCSEVSSIKNLLLLRDNLRNELRVNHAELVGIIRADSNSGVERVKSEVMLEQACNELEIECHLFHANTIRNAQKKKVVEVAGNTLEIIYNNGNAINPKYLTNAAYCAWCTLNV